MVQFCKIERAAMKLLEIKNNLVKLLYSETEMPVLGRFIVLSSEVKSYVAQFINLKSDSISSFAIAKLLFTFSSDGVVDNYDGSVPPMNSELSLLPAGELLGLLPVENPLKIGALAQQDDMLTVDASIFERNLTVFTEKNSNKTVFISNSIRQLFQMKEKSVIIDTSNLFEDYEKIEFGKDFKLPLNSQMIDYLFENELSEVDATTKAVIQDIFYAVQEYIKTLDFEFLPIDNFVDVVTNQYKETQMPELALLKNKLLKYRDSNVFANSKEEVFALKEKLETKNCSIIDLKNTPEVLQKEILSFIHNVLNSFDKYIYFFVPLTDNNSDKKLLKQFLNHNHIFTTILVSSSYKYASELKENAQNLIIFAPKDVNRDFASYNTFLNKLNPDECIVCGKLTQGIPFIVAMADLELDLTKDDVLGEHYQFIPAVEDLQLVKIDDYGNKIPVNLNPQTEETPAETAEEVDKEVVAAIPVIEQPPIEVVDDAKQPEVAIPENSEETAESIPTQEPVLDTSDTQEEELSLEGDNLLEEAPVIIEETPSGDILDIEEEPEELQVFNPTEMLGDGEIYEEGAMSREIYDNGMVKAEDSLSFETVEDVFGEHGEKLEEPVIENIIEEEPEEPVTFSPGDAEGEEIYPEPELQPQSDENQDYSYYDEQTLTEDDLNFLEDSGSVQPDAESFDIDNAVDTMFEEEDNIDQPPAVPVYPAEEPKPEEEFAFKQGDKVSHHRYGRGIVEKIITYGNKTLCSISFENVGRRLLDPTITELTKIGGR